MTPTSHRQPPAPPSRLARTLPLFLLGLLAVLFFARFLFTGRFFLLRDLVFDFHARQIFYKEHLLQGTLPLWNPYTGCGEPFLSNIESAVFYPLNLLHLLLPVTNATVVSVTFHLFLAAAGVWLCCRTWDISPAGALLAAVAFAFSTHTVTRIEFFSFICSYAWYPLVVALFSRWLLDPTLRRFLLVAMALALQLLGGYPEALLFTSGTITLLACGWIIACRGGKGFSARSLLPLAGLTGMLALAFLLTAAQILPVIDIVPDSLRADTRPLTAMASVNPGMLWGVFFPFLYGGRGYLGKYWAPSCYEFWLGNLYIGILPVLLCLTGAVWFLCRRRRAPAEPDTPPIPPLARLRTPFLLTLLAVSLLYAMGHYTPFFKALWQVIPPLRLFRWPAKALMCAVFAGCCLAGIAFDRLGKSSPTAGPGHRLLLWGPFAAWLTLALFAFACLLDGGRLGKWLLLEFFHLDTVDGRYAHRIPWPLMTRDCLKLGAATLVSTLVLQAYLLRPSWRRLLPWAMAALLFADLSVTTAPLLPSSAMDILNNRGAYLPLFTSGDQEGRFYRFDSQQYFYGETNEANLRLARDSMESSWPMADKAHAVKPMGDFKLRNLAAVLSLFEKNLVARERGAFLLQLMHCRTIITPGLQQGYFEGEGFPPPAVYAQETAYPRAFVVGRVQTYPDDQAVVHALANLPFDPLEVALANRHTFAGAEKYQGRAGEGRIDHRISRLADGLNSLTVELTSERSGLLVVSDTFYHGWEAMVNGESAPIFEVNRAFRAVPVPAGTSTVVMRYRPQTLAAGLLLSGAGWLATLLLLFFPALFPRGAEHGGDSGAAA
ncbi:MAG: YfhO family protein [Thermodesulfobacteriota bacterium]